MLNGHVDGTTYELYKFIFRLGSAPVIPLEVDQVDSEAGCSSWDSMRTLVKTMTREPLDGLLR